MARVIYDGTKIVVDAARLDVDKLNKLAEKFNAEYLPTLNAFAFNRTINSVLEIAKIENAIFDESFLNLKSKIDKAVQKKQDEIAALNLPECMYPFQKETVWQMLKMTGNILLASDMGCIDGEAIVRVRRCGTTKQMKLKDLYTRFHSKRLEEKYTLEEQPIYIRGFDGTYYKQNEIIDVLDKGEKECIKLILESGKEIILTPDHVVFTKEGEIKSENSLNKFIMVENKHHKKELPKVCKICGSTENIIHCRGAVYFGYCYNCMKKNKKEHGAYVDDYKEVIDRDGYVILQGKMFSDYKGKKSRNGIPKHRYVMEQYLGRLLRSDEVVHHIDRNKLNNDISNLQLVTKEEHMRIHQELETWYAAFHCVPSYEKVIKIENVGKRHVYDVKVKDHHNFLANDILVHNCGKSCMTIEYLACAAKHIECYPVVVVCPASLKTNWAVEFKKWNPSVTTYVINGRTSYEDLYVLNSAKQADVVIINYDILGVDDKEAQKREKERIKIAKEKGYRYRKAFIPISGWVDYINDVIKPNVVVCDECFIAGTKINTLFGLKDIETINVGDFVLSCNEKGCLEYKVVTNVSKKNKKCNYCYVSDNLGHFVVCTDNHKFFTDFDYCEEISYLQNGNEMLSLVHDRQEINNRVEPNNSRNFIRRWKYFLCNKRIKKSKTKNITLFEKFRLCNEKIRECERILQSTSERNCESWMGKEFIRIYNEISSRYENLSRIILFWEKESDKARNPKLNKRRRFSLLVSRRWKFQWYAAYLYLCFFIRGTLYFAKMALREFWNKFGHIKRQKKEFIFSFFEKRSKKQILSYDRTLCCGINEIQIEFHRYKEAMRGLWQYVFTVSQKLNILFKRMSAESTSRKTITKSILKKEMRYEQHDVYDITVADNHNFFANGFLVHNCQAIESSKTVRTRGVTQIAVNENIQKVFLSGTPFDTRVAQFYNACHLLAPDLFPKEWDFKQRYCAPRYNGFGWEYKGASNIPELREKLSGIMIRHIKEEVLSQLPEKQKIPIYFDMDKNSRKVYDSMEMELAEQEEGIHQFAYLAKMREALVDIKLEAVIQFIKDMLEVEDKLVVFTFHNRMYDELMKIFGKQAVGINGSVPSEKRQEMVDAFQKDENVKIFVGQTQAASTGITLTASHTVIFTEWASTISQMEQATDRIHRIGQKAERCLIYYLIVKDTVDEDPYYNLSEHYADMKAVMDGNTEATFLDINESMIARVKQRKLMKNKKGVQIEYE